jgi:acetyl esterase/lipase
MMLSRTRPRTTTALSHPQFDPELTVILDGLPPEMNRPLAVEDLPDWRENIVLALSASDDQLSRGGTVQVSERQIPGPDGAPDLTITIMRPSAGAGPWPGIYHTHSGGMVIPGAGN